ncbi:hypothetical protein PIB30_071572 [Stylosanthes scabra]|uniref:Cytochrome P450 n=1 Tax=Stylosanthes scabra TaxID=79078 RepID=A0ABU6TNL0_9FABA|nr:hypothetical protein [Stylosanthes scabra]
MEFLALLLISFFVFAIVHLLVSNLVFKTQKSSTKLPPGPKPLPIIGNILQLGTQPHQSLTKLSQTYGPIMTLKLGNITTIVISSPQLAKEVLHKNDLISTYRSVPDTLRALDHNIYSVGWMQPSNEWRILRKICATKVFSSQQLDSTQVLRQKKVREMIDFIKERSVKGEALDVGEIAFITVLNFVSNSIFSMDLGDYNSSKSQEWKKNFCCITEEAGKPNVVDFFPIFRMLDPQGARARMTKYFRELIDFFDGLIEERLKSRSPKMETNQACKDVLDSVLQVMLEENSQVSRLHVLHLFLVLLVAGVETTSITIEWAMAELLKSAKKLEKVRNELQHVLGKDEQLEEKHIPKLPFLKAVVKETFRLHPPAPFLVPHKSQEDVKLCGFNVPKNAQIWVNVWAMGRDSSIWRNPNEFMPERFLESEIDFQGHDFELIPFGAGKRMCPGLPMAYRGVHILLGSLLHCFDWKLANEEKEEDLDMSENFGITLRKAQSLQAIPIKLYK